jgi:hypothetical protein
MTMQNKGSLYVGLLLILVGVMFLFIEGAARLLQPLGVRLGWSNLWPLLLILVGLAFWLPLLVWWNRRSELAGFAVPATLFTVNGLIMLYTAITGRWEAWAYLWTLEPIALGLSFLVLYYLTNRHRALAVVAAILIAIGGFFFLIFASAFGGMIAIIGPLFLIAAGLILLMRGRLARRDGPEF